MRKLNISKIIIMVLLSTFVGCATSNRNAYKKLRKDIDDKKIDQAISLVQSDKFYPEKRSKLLKLLELANLQHIKGDYYQSLVNFDKAKDLSDQLFTVSMSKKALAAVTNNNMDNYYGEIYERSIIRFYQALNHYMLYQNGVREAHVVSHKVKNGDVTVIKKKMIEERILTSNEKRSHLAGARASLLEWDSLLDNYTKMNAGESTYKVDLSSRLFGAFIHEQMGTTSDRAIAIGLYKDAKKILFRNYNLYPAFNSKHKEFASDYKKLPTYNELKVKKDYVKSTKYATELLAFIDTKIKGLKSRKKNNVTIILQQGYVAEKTAKLIHFPLPISSMPQSGGMVQFAGEMLATTQGTLPSITFELPQVEQKKTQKDIVLIIKDNEGKVVSTTDAIVINPISDIAFQAMDNKIVSTYSKIGARLAVKHIAAIMAAYETSKKSGRFVASMIYAASNKAIAASEQADLRFWSTLPHTLRMGSFSLAAGEYSLSIKTTDKEKSTEHYWKKFTVLPKQSQLLNLNVM